MRIKVETTGGNCCALTATLPNGRFAVATDMDGTSLPHPSSWLVTIHASEQTWNDGEDALQCAQSADYEPAQSVGIAAALLIVAAWRSPAHAAVRADSIEHPNVPVPMPDIGEALACLTDQSRGEECRDMLDDLVERVGYPAELVAPVMLWTLARDGVRPMATLRRRQREQGTRPSAAELDAARIFETWEGVLTDACHLRARG